MAILIGRVHEIVRYPIKSMAGIPAESAVLGWHGLAGDRRFAFRRVGENGGFPWLTASRLPELVLYQPTGQDDSTGEPLPTQVRTPAGRELELRGDELRDEVSSRLGSAVELMHLKQGIFDDAPVSLIALETMAGLAREAGREIDRRRFRANIVLDTAEHRAFLEDGWVGGTMIFGDQPAAPAVWITARDLRCVMINLDPDTAAADPCVMKAAASLNESCAGVYATVVRTGILRAGDSVRFVEDRNLA